MKGLIIKLNLAAVTAYWTHEALSLSLFISGCVVLHKRLLSRRSE